MFKSKSKSFQKCGLFFISDAGCLDLAVFNLDDGWNCVNAELVCKLAVIINVYLADLDVVALFSDLIHDRGYHSAGAAPCRPEIENNGLVALQNFGFKVVFIYYNN